MYALAINGSPRKNGNTSYLLKEVLIPLKENGWDTETVQVGGKNIRGCVACYKCFENKDSRCSVKDDIFNSVMEKMIRADALILGSPTYFTDVSAELKALIDRSGLVSPKTDYFFSVFKFCTYFFHMAQGCHFPLKFIHAQACFRGKLFRRHRSIFFKIIHNG